MKTIDIHVTGQVQGVGFRPQVYRYAIQYNVLGWVSNGPDGVHIVATATTHSLRDFVKQIEKFPPPNARIESCTLEERSLEIFDSFRIHDSIAAGLSNVRLSPDFALCESCREELADESNRRNGYAFTTCTQCGPRYSIMQALPYDRAKTSMDHVPMCAACLAEYEDPNDKRFYSQTNSCPDCEIKLHFYEKGKELLLPSGVIPGEIASRIKYGAIVGVKGIGGYLLICDATNPLAIKKLRERKHRAAKPLALMFRDENQLSHYVYYSDAELNLLKSLEAPIILLKSKINTLPIKAIAPGLHWVGAMLAYAPLYYQILQQLETPVVATSGNLSGSPIVYSDDQALHELFRFADFIVTHDRAIVVPQDDSVIRYSGVSGRKTLLRRSRGYAPSYFGVNPGIPDNWLALGAQMKGAFAFSTNGQLYCSQYLGSMESFDAQESYKEVLQHLSAMTKLKAQRIFTDQHPGYFVHDLAASLSVSSVAYVQHHIAHFSSLLMEKDLFKASKAILGVVWDGTGFGGEGAIFGSEFYRYQNYSFTHLGSLSPVGNISGDKMALEPRLSALAFCENIIESESLLRPKFSPAEFRLYQRILRDANQLENSSMGRLFDAVASLLDLVDIADYEGQAAMYVEALAESSAEPFHPYDLDFRGGYVDTKKLIRQIILEIRRGRKSSSIASRFHDSLVEMIRQVATTNHLQRIAMTGGVFQNNLLCDRIEHQLSADFELYFHEELSPNDENIAMGQLAYGLIEQKREALGKKQVETRHDSALQP